MLIRTFTPGEPSIRLIRQPVSFGVLPPQRNHPTAFESALQGLAAQDALARLRSRVRERLGKKT